MSPRIIPLFGFPALLWLGLGPLAVMASGMHSPYVEKGRDLERVFINQLHNTEGEVVSQGTFVRHHCGPQMDDPLVLPISLSSRSQVFISSARALLQIYPCRALPFA